MKQETSNQTKQKISASVKQYCIDNPSVRRENQIKRYNDERLKLLTLPWKTKIFIDGFYHCPVCDFKTKKLTGLYSHLGNSDLYDKIYEKYFGEVGKCEQCGKPTKIISFVKGYHRFCSNECCADEKRQRLKRKDIVEKRKHGLKLLYNDEKRLNNRNIKIGKANKIKTKEYIEQETAEHREERIQKQSNTMKKLIADGKFIPNINNVYNGKIIVYNSKKYRSSWELLFHLIHPEIEYEKTILQYISTIDNKQHNYIVDFTDNVNKVLFEIKPYSRLFDRKNVDKFLCAEMWCKENGYTFKIIDEFYLKENITDEVLSKIPIEIKRKLKCFVK